MDLQLSHKSALWKISIPFIAVAVLSVGLKYLVIQSDVAMDSRAVARQLTASLVQRGLTVRSQEMFAGTLVTAEGRGCRLAVRPVPPSGELDQTFGETFRAYPRTRYWFEGSMTPRPPRFAASITYQSARIANRLGVASQWKPLLIVGDNGGCPAEVTDFGAVRAPFVQQVPDAQRR